MAETVRNKTDLLSIFPLNTTGLIDAQDERDFIESVKGKLWTVIKSSGSPYTVTDDDDVIIVTESANYTINLPAVASSTHRVIRIKKKSSATYSVTIDANASETIDGATTLVLTLQYSSVTLVCDGVEWHVL